jgi:stage II sporulation protein D
MIRTVNEPLISVGIMLDKHINFELYGDFKTAGSDIYLSGRFTAEIVSGRIICKRGNDRYDFGEEIIFEPRDIGTESFLLREVTIGLKFHWERKEKQRFTGSLKLIRKLDQVQVINILPIEKYLVSVISSEMNARSSLQFLKAHAVVSRSWVLAQMEKNGKAEEDNKNTGVKSSTREHIKWYNREEHKLFNVCSDDHCQRYQGITKIISDNALTAVEQTRGIVLVYNDEICDTRYSKACGGLTESYSNVWEPVHHQYLTSVADYKFEQDGYLFDFTKEKNAERWITKEPPAYCNTREKKILSQILNEYDQETKNFYRWEVEYTQQELSGIIKEKSGIDFGEIVDLIPVERGDSARLVKLKIKGSKHSLIVGKELEIRKFLSKTHLYSSAFIIIKENIVNGIPGKFIIKGAGWGHGVGLCQIGAAVMASKGFQFDEILLHYFPGAKIKKIH